MNWVRVSLIGFLICAAIALLAIGAAVVDLSVRVPAIVERQLNQTRADLIEQIGQTRSALIDQVTKAESDLNKQVTIAESDAALKIDATTDIVNARLNDTNRVLAFAVKTYDETAIAAIGAELERVDPIAANVADITAKFNAQEPMLYSRTLATTGELDKLLDASRLTANAVAKAAPQFTSDITSMTGYVAGFTKPKPPQGFFGRLKSHIGTAALIGAKVFLMK